MKEQTRWRIGLQSGFDDLTLRTRKAPLARLREHARGELLDQPRLDLFRSAVLDLTCSCRRVSAAAMGEAERAYIHRRGPVENRLADRKHRVLLLETPEHMHGEAALGKQG